jgi:hypothetical protein
MAEQELNLEATEGSTAFERGSVIAKEPPQPFDPNKQREETRGDLARGLLWLLTFSIGGVLAFIGLGRLEGTVLTQSIFPSLIALAGTALGFYFGSQQTQQGNNPTETPGSTSPSPTTPPQTPTLIPALMPTSTSDESSPSPPAQTGVETKPTGTTTGASSETDGD